MIFFYFGVKLYFHGTKVIKHSNYLFRLPYVGKNEKEYIKLKTENFLIFYLLLFLRSVKLEDQKNHRPTEGAFKIACILPSASTLPLTTLETELSRKGY